MSFAGTTSGQSRELHFQNWNNSKLRSAKGCGSLLPSEVREYRVEFHSRSCETACAELSELRAEEKCLVCRRPDLV